MKNRKKLRGHEKVPPLPDHRSRFTGDESKIKSFNPPDLISGLSALYF
ncbi:MAG TPA: hypothetical protein GXX76_10225 [Bacteroidales bacterium]|nr:hypothetical protein [Bacteroidales bacterium]